MVGTVENIVDVNQLFGSADRHKQVKKCRRYFSSILVTHHHMSQHIRVYKQTGHQLYLCTLKYYGRLGSRPISHIILYSKICSQITGLGFENRKYFLSKCQENFLIILSSGSHTDL